MNIELLGYLASVVILLGFMLKGEKRIRTVNMIGSLLFIVYGITIHAYPVAFLNALTICVNLYALRKEQKSTDNEE